MEKSNGKASQIVHTAQVRRIMPGFSRQRTRTFQSRIVGSKAESRNSHPKTAMTPMPPETTPKAIKIECPICEQPMTRVNKTKFKCDICEELGFFTTEATIPYRD